MSLQRVVYKEKKHPGKVKALSEISPYKKEFYWKNQNLLIRK